MKIGLDLDEVICDFIDALLKFYHKRTGKLHFKEEFKEYKWWPVWGITREEAVKIVDEFHETNNLEDVRPAEGAIESINSLLNKKDQLFVITARPVRFKKRVEDWINYHLKTDKIKVIHAGDFHKGQAINKSEICMELRIRILLEDSGETALECANKDIKVILFDKPWNKQFNHNNIYRVNNWQEAISKINSFQKTIKPQDL